MTHHHLQFAPHELENGMFSAKVELVNEGQKAVAIAGVKKPCDCVTLRDGWAGILGPGERRTVFVDVDGRKWGVGRQKRAIDFVSVTGGSFRLMVEGESLADSSGIGRFEMSRHLYVPLNCGQLPVSHSASVKFEAVGPIGVKYRCESQQEWLKGQITDGIKDGGSMIALTATFDESLINRISSGGNVSAIVDVFAPSETVSRGRIEVVYIRRIDAIAKPRVIQLSGGEGECEISIDESVDDGWELSRIECMDNELDVASRSIAERLWKISVRAKQTGLARQAVVVFCVFTKPGEVPVRVQIPIVQRTRANAS